ncbi:hypothetical protein EXS57_03590 [Candidatus Kaiserbacteria bacterium]|nr:hypothetical protein [Candidatus Kaiserbacteria bacterium]
MINFLKKTFGLDRSVWEGLKIVLWIALIFSVAYNFGTDLTVFLVLTVVAIVFYKLGFFR